MKKIVHSENDMAVFRLMKLHLPPVFGFVTLYAIQPLFGLPLQDRTSLIKKLHQGSTEKLPFQT